MYYGHGSWIVPLVFVALFALRALSSRRRRDAQRRPEVFTPSFTRPDPRGSTEGPATQPSDTTGMSHTGIPAGWLVDPSGRHDQRYWSGSDWTDHVTDGGVPGTDPLPHPPSEEGAP